MQYVDHAVEGLEGVKNVEMNIDGQKYMAVEVPVKESSEMYCRLAKRAKDCGFVIHPSWLVNMDVEYTYFDLGNRFVMVRKQHDGAMERALNGLKRLNAHGIPGILAKMKDLTGRDFTFVEGPTCYLRAVEVRGNRKIY